MMTNQNHPEVREEQTGKRRRDLFGFLRGGRNEQSNSAAAAEVSQVSVSAENSEDAMMAAIVGAVTANAEQSAILAAITAAISVVWESEYPGTGFRVVSYRHIDKRSPWNAR